MRYIMIYVLNTIGKCPVIYVRQRTLLQVKLTISGVNVNVSFIFYMFLKSAGKPPLYLMHCRDEQVFLKRHTALRWLEMLWICFEKERVYIKSSKGI